MGKLAAICLGVTLSSPAFAQSASSFDAAPSYQAEPIGGSKKVAKPAPASAGEIDPTPSRLVAPPAIESYLKSVSSLLLMQNRERDPFGMTQNPEAEPVAKVSMFGNNAAPVVKRATPLSEIVAMISITTIMPGQKMFLVGSRPFKQGNLIPIRHQGKPLRVQIMEVTSQQITFRNLDTGETANRNLSFRPAGMKPGSQGVTVPGMTTDSQNAPIDLDAGVSAP